MRRRNERRSSISPMSLSRCFHFIGYARSTCPSVAWTAVRCNFRSKIGAHGDKKGVSARSRNQRRARAPAIENARRISPDRQSRGVMGRPTKHACASSTASVHDPRTEAGSRSAVLARRSAGRSTSGRATRSHVHGDEAPEACHEPHHRFPAVGLPIDVI